MIIELLIGLVTFLLICDYLYKKRYNAIFKKDGISGPRAWPLVGNALLAVGNDTEKIFALLKQVADRHGKIFRLWFFHDCIIFIQDARYFESILSSSQLIKKNSFYNLLVNWLGDGLLLSNGAKWHARRKVITPTFHFKILEQFVEVFDQQSSVMVKMLDNKADGETVINIFPVVCLATLDIIAETAMGVKINAQMNPDFPYAKAVTTVADIIATRTMKINQRFDLTFYITEPRTAWKLERSIETLHTFTNNVIEERRMVLERSIADGSYKSIETENDADIGKKRRMAFLDVLLQSSTSNGKPLTNHDIREEVDTFMFEGHDTTTSGISFTLYLIARHPAVQQKLFEEIRQIIGEDREKAITMRDLQELKYLECVIKEGLRLYPPVPFIGRIPENDTEINGTTFPANCNISLLLYAAMRDPDYFPDPDAFRPERFSADNAQKINPFAYVPFSAGPRNCIGQKFAILEMKSTISKLLRYYELLPLGEDVRPVNNIILRSLTGMNIGLRTRVYQNGLN